MSVIRYPRLAQMLYDVPLMITYEKAAVIESVFRQLCAGHANLNMPKMGEDDGPAPVNVGSKPYGVTSDGTALIPIHGTLMHRAGMMDALSGMDSYTAIAGRMSAALADPDVKAMLLDIDSPGGQVAGAFELSKFIREAASVKPIYAVADEFATSAAYLLGSAATKFYAPKLGTVGSIGVIAMHVDQSKQDEQRGLAYTPLYAGAHKNDMSPHAPLSDAAKMQLQARLDTMYDEFVSTVATNRGIDEKAVRGTEARILSASEATSLGLIDGVMSMGEVLSLIGNDVQQHSTGAAATAHTHPQETQMEQPNTAAAALTPEAVALQIKAAQEQATARIKAIQMSDAAKARPSLASHLAFNTSMSAEDAIALMVVAAPETPAAAANALAAAMTHVPNPPVGGDADASATTMSDEDKAAVFILNAGKRRSLKA